jgi:hypothetical protein
MEMVHVRANARRYPNAPLSTVPRQIGIWKGREVANSASLEAARRQVNDLLYREYRAPGKPLVEVVLLYWGPGEGTLLGRRSHVPEGCYPYHGMQLEWTREIELTLDSEPLRKAALRASVFSGPNGKRLVTSWQQTGSASSSDERLPKNRLELLLYGLREIFHLGAAYPPELALQLITPLQGDQERILSAHQKLAQQLIPLIAEGFLSAGPTSSGSAGRNGQPGVHK